MVSVGLLGRKTIRELRASRSQTLALVIVVALGVAVFVASVGSYRDLAASEATTYNRLRLADVWFELEPTTASVVDEVAARRGVAAVAGRLVVDTGLVVGDDRARGRLVGVAPGPASVNDVVLIEGRRPRGPGEALLERTFADRRGVRPGDTVTPLIDGIPAPLRVTGTVASPEYIQVTPDRFELLSSPSGFGVLFVDLAELQRLTANQDRINDIAVRFDRTRDTDLIAGIEADLRRRGGLLDVVPRAEQASYAALEQDLASFRSVAAAMPAIILLAGIASMAVMLGRIVRAQRPLIGVMKAIGYRDGAVLGHYLTYALIIGLLGAAVGIVAGSVLGGIVTRGYTAEIGVPFTTPRFHPGLASAAAAISVTAVTLAALRPALRSARIPPALAVRMDTSSTGTVGRRNRLERFVRLPLTTRLPLRTFGRPRGRAAATGLGIVSAIVLVLMVLGLRDGIDLFVSRTFDDLERWSIAATFDEPTSPDTAKEVTSWPGVRTVAPFLELPARLDAGGARRVVLLTALQPDQTLRPLRLGDEQSAQAALQPGRIVVTDALAGDLDVSVGDPLTVTTPIGAIDLVVGGTSDEPIPPRAFVGLETVTAFTATPAPPVNGLYLRVDADTAIKTRARLYDLPGVSAVKLRTEMRADLQSFLSIFDIVIATMLAFAAAMAFALLFNAMTINVLEREREYATMRAVGAQPRFIGRLLVIEAVLLWVLALVPGALIGSWVASRLGEAISADLFALPVSVSVRSYVVTVVGVLVTIMLALVLPMRRVGRLDLAASTKTIG